MSESGVHYEELMLRPEQRQIVYHVCEVISARLDLDEAPVRGFFWRALREWQQKRGLPTASMRDMKPSDRLEAAEQIGVVFRGMLRKYLSEDHRTRIDEAWAEALRTYEANYARPES